MRTEPGPPHRWARQRLWLARALAWALLLGGWIVLGGLGRQHLPLAAGGQAPVALWLLAIGAALGLSRRVDIDRSALRAGLLALGAAAAASLALMALMAQSGAWLFAAAGAWGGLLVAASLTVRGLRRAQTGPLTSPMSAALAGAGLAAALAGDVGAVRDIALPAATALGIAAAALALLAAPQALARGGCRSGLFDCALMPGSSGAWRHPTGWPLVAAGWAMLPMMAGLGPMADWCGTLPWPPGAGRLLHLGAMLLPAALLQWAPTPGLAGRHLAGVMATLLAVGGLALLWPGIAGLVTASLLQAAAWSLAWGQGLRRPATDRPRLSVMPAPACNRRDGLLAATAVTVILLGLAIDLAGAAVLVAVHAVLAGAGLAGLIGLGLHQPAPPSPRPVSLR